LKGKPMPTSRKDVTIKPIGIASIVSKIFINSYLVLYLVCC
jgi:hypothetical protein